MKHTFTIPGRPQVKQRPRMTRRGRVYTPEATIAYERHVAESYHDGPLFTGPVTVRIRLHKDKAVVTIQDVEPATSGLRGDVDNYVKSILDGLQPVAITNDRQVVRVDAAK